MNGILRVNWLGFAGILLLVTLFWVPGIVGAQLSSSSFQMTADSVNCGGGRTSSSSFSIVGTLCETATMPPTDDITFPTSTNFNLEQGFPAMDDVPFISVSLLNAAGTEQKSSISFGTLTQGSVANDTLLVRVTTNALSGYSATLMSDGGLRSGTDTINPISDGTVDGSSNASHGEYGFRTSGTDGLYNSTDTSVTTSAKVFAQKTSRTTLSETTVTFKAAVGGSNVSGSFSQALSIVVTGSF
ncbi:MAG: hypothetical protein Q8P56_00140 [Candidatus Uhrbacteria bacterium]|nr:hypothetical protein [Candidatus Uhrbacteria bacterium]